MQKQLIRIFVISCLSLLMADVQAEDILSKWSFSGFGSFGGIGTDTDAIGFYRHTTQTKAATKSWGVTTDSRLGLQLDFNAGETLHATIQWIARDHAGDFFEQNLEWAFLRWSPRNDIDIRVGRLGTDFYLLSDYVDVGYAYLWMRPPHEFYAYIPFSHFDGLDISKRYHLGKNYLSLKLFAGHSHTSTRQNQTAINSVLAGVNISYISGNWQAKISYAYSQILNELFNQSFINTLNTPLPATNLSYIRKTIPELTTVNTYTHFTSIGSAYDDGVWVIQAEAAYAANSSPFFPSQASAYFSVGRRFEQLTFYTVYAVVHTLQDKANISGSNIPASQLKQFNQVLETFVTQNKVDEQSLSVGFRWDFYANIAFKAQWNHYWLGSRNIIQQWEILSQGKTSNKVNVWSLGLDFVF